MKARLFLPIFIFFLYAIPGCSQTNSVGSKLNLDFEDVRNGEPQSYYVAPWKKHKITLNMASEKTQRIVLGGLLVEKGKMRVDSLQITIVSSTAPFV